MGSLLCDRHELHTSFRAYHYAEAVTHFCPFTIKHLISTVKDTSLASLVWIAELFRVAQNITAENYEFILIYSEAALIYWVFCFVLSMGQTRLEKRLSRHL